LRLYTPQAPEALAAADQRGYLAGDPRFIDPDFLAAYAWMRQQMAKRLVAFSGDAQVWAWTKRPDLRTVRDSAHARLVLIVFDVPPERTFRRLALRAQQDAGRPQRGLGPRAAAARSDGDHLGHHLRPCGLHSAGRRASDDPGLRRPRASRRDRLTSRICRAGTQVKGPLADNPAVQRETFGRV
jgi:hypothetical protein